MTQRINVGKLGATGIIGVLFIMGLILVAVNVAPEVGYTAIVAAVLIGILYAAMGAGGIARRNRWIR